MTSEEAEDLLRGAVPSGPAHWADLGAGHGTFTEALARLLGSGGKLVALDRDEAAVRALRRLERSPDMAAIQTLWGDFRDPMAIAALASEPLDGVLFANALHFASDAAEVLAMVAREVRPGGRVVIVEYDRAGANPWVPYPIPERSLARTVLAAGLSEPHIVGRRPSRYHHAMYSAWCAVPEAVAALRADRSVR